MTFFGFAPRRVVEYFICLFMLVDHLINHLNLIESIICEC